MAWIDIVMTQDVIAIICDCDGTLCPDTTNLLVAELGLDPKTFWQEVNSLVEGGWDPPLAYLGRLLTLSRSGVIKPLTKNAISSIAQGVQFYPGALEFVSKLRERLYNHPDMVGSGTVIDWYIVSSGIEELLMATPLGSMATDVFGSTFHYGPDGQAAGVKSSVTFTEKTKFIYAINKGIPGLELRKRPYRVNDAVVDSERRVPLEHMVYIGDGPSDIPCFSMIKRNNGHAIGVMPPEDMDLRKPFELARGRRLTVGPYTADYGENSDLFKILWRIVESIATGIMEHRAQGIRPAPSH